MKTTIQELIQTINLITKTYKRGLSTLEILDMCNNQLDKEKEQMLDLIRFMRTNNKMGKSVVDLYNEFINQ